MKKGINIWSFPEGTSVAQCITMAKDAGFEGIELALGETGEVSLESTEKEILEIKKVAENEGIVLPSLATGLYWGSSFTSNKAEVRKKADTIARKQLEIAALLGADTILVVPGAVGVDFIPGSEIIDYDVAYERAMEAMLSLKKEAEQLKVSIGIENVWNKFLLSPLEMRGFIDKIDSDYIGAYLDVGNIIQIGYPEQWVKILAHRIKKIHFKDFRRNVGNLDGFVDLLAGDVNYPAVMAALEKVGYTDYCIGEMIPNYQHHTSQIVYNTSKSMDRILGL